IDEFAELEAPIQGLAAGPTKARVASTAWIEAVRVAADKPYSSVGTALLRLASQLARALGDDRAATALPVQAVKRSPDDDALVDDTDVAVTELGDEAQKRAFEEALPPSRRCEALLHLAEKHERAGYHDLAITALERALGSGDLRPEIQER